MKSDPRSEHEKWLAYFIPGTTVLANKLGIDDQELLSEAEGDVTALIAGEIGRGNRSIEGSTLAQQLCSSHAQLFDRVYDWAGEFRDVGMSKRNPNNPRNVHPFAPPNQIETHLDGAQRKIDAFDWDAATHDEKVDLLAEVHTQVNFAHPFREGNGRATRLVMTALAEEHGVELDFNAVERDRWNRASASTYVMFERQFIGLNADPMKDVYAEVASEITTREVEPETSVEREQPATGLLDRLGMTTTSVSGLETASGYNAAESAHDDALPEQSRDASPEL